jgi:hypothetical protein
VSEESDWADAIREAIARSLDGVHTSIPAKVTQYIPAIQQCAVEPVIAGMPPLEDVPVQWPRGGGYFVHLPLTAGDHVLLTFCEQDFGPWRLSGSAQAPALLRRHGLFAYAVPGAAPDTSPIIPAATLTGAAIGAETGVIIQVGTANAQVGPLGVAALPVMTAAEFTALMASFVATLNTHTHVCAAPGAPSGPPVPTSTPPSAVGSGVLLVSS